MDAFYYTQIFNRLQHISAMKKSRSARKGPFQVAVLGCMAERLKTNLLEQEKWVDVGIFWLRFHQYRLNIKAIIGHFSGRSRQLQRLAEAAGHHAVRPTGRQRIAVAGRNLCRRDAGAHERQLQNRLCVWHNQCGALK